MEEHLLPKINEKEDNVTLIPSGSIYNNGRIVVINDGSSYNDGHIFAAMNGDSSLKGSILIELVETLVVIVAAIVVLVTQSEEEQDYISVTMISSYISVSISTLPVVCCRFWQNNQMVYLKLSEKMMKIMKFLESFRNTPKYFFVGWGISCIWNLIPALLYHSYATLSFWLCWAFFVIICIRYVRPNLNNRGLYVVLAVMAPLGDILMSIYYTVIDNLPLLIMLSANFLISITFVIFEVVVVKNKAVDLGHDFLISQPLLNGPNYNEWASNLRKALEATKKFGYVDGTIPCPGDDSDDLEDWRSTNGLVLSWMKLTMGDEVRSSFSDVEVASQLWDHIRLRCLVENRRHVLRIKAELATCRQHGMTIESYHEKFMQLWNSLAEFRVPKSCDCPIGINLQKEREEDCLHEFLEGLDESVYGGTVKSNLLSREPLPNVGEAYRLLCPTPLLVENIIETHVQIAQQAMPVTREDRSIMHWLFNTSLNFLKMHWN